MPVVLHEEDFQDLANSDTDAQLRQDMKIKNSEPRPTGLLKDSLPLKVRRPPCALLSVGAVTEADVAVLKKLGEAGFEIVVVQDENFEHSMKIIEEIRKPSTTIPLPVLKSLVYSGDDEHKN